MRLTRAGEYAVRCVLYLSMNDRGQVVSRKEVARAMDVPDQFLGKIAQQLSRAGIVEIVQGAKGGLRLLRTPSKINLLDVVEAVIGEIFLNDCIMNPDSCPRSEACSVNKVWEKAKTQLRATLRDASFEKLMKKETCLLPISGPEDLNKDS